MFNLTKPALRRIIHELHFSEILRFFIGNNVFFLWSPDHFYPGGSVSYALKLRNGSGSDRG